jgi:uncharacterized protein YecE (DUF72 family)
MVKFFSTVDREGLNFAWEPRGSAWTIDIVSALCRDLDLWHAVDPFALRSETPEKCYFRMHGRIRWRYSYDLTELEELATLLPSAVPSYVFFNNVTMSKDAKSLQQILTRNLKEGASRD